MENLFWRLLTLAIYAAVMFGIYKLLSAVVYSLGPIGQNIALIVAIGGSALCLAVGLWLDRRR